MDAQTARYDVAMLRENTEHLIFEGASNQKKLLIVFAYINQKLGTRSHSTFLQNVDCKKLFINPGVNEWYQTGVPGVAANYSELLKFLQGVSEDFADHELLCLGHSMGGYPALGIGVSLGASRILASAPEFVLNMPGSISVRRLQDTKLDCADLTPILTHNSKTKITVLVGKNNAFDMAVGRQLRTFPRTEVIELESGHDTFPHLRDQKKLAETLEAFVDNRDLRPILEH